MDIAASIQQVTEDIMLRSAKHVHNETGLSNLCLAGDMALNRAGVGRLLRESPFDRVWIPPAPGDAGGALGVALLVWYQLLGNERTAGETDALLGAEYNDGDIEGFLKGVSGHAGPRMVLPPTALHSCPSASPKRAINSVSQLAAWAMPEGNAVQRLPLEWKPIPRGPSVSLNGLMPNRSTGFVFQNP